jgi:hypothetical protein
MGYTRNYGFFRLARIQETENKTPDLYNCLVDGFFFYYLAFCMVLKYAFKKCDVM